MFCSATVEVMDVQKPHGGALVDVRAPADKHESIIASCTKTVECTDRQACDVELLTYGCVLRLLLFPSGIARPITSVRSIPWAATTARHRYQEQQVSKSEHRALFRTLASACTRFCFHQALSAALVIYVMGHLHKWKHAEVKFSESTSREHCH